MESAPYRPSVIVIAAEHVEDAYVWDHSPGEHGAGLDPSHLLALGAGADLLARLSAWNDTYGRLAVTDFQWRAEQSEADWEEEGFGLALELQRDLPDVDVRYGSRPPLRPQLGLPPLSVPEPPAGAEGGSGAYAYAPLSGAIHRGRTDRGPARPR